MKMMLYGLLALALAIPATSQERKMIYVDKMEGLESFVEKALQNAELPFDFIEETKSPAMKAQLKKMHSAYGEILYRHKFGRNETHRLELRDVETNKVIAWHSFPLVDSDEGRTRAADEFARKVKDAWGKSQR